MEDIVFIQPNWPLSRRVKACTTTRASGFSQEPFDGFNLAAHVGDNIAAVAKNRQLLHVTLNLPSDIVWLRQTHTANVLHLPLPEKIVNEVQAHALDNYEGHEVLKQLMNCDAAITKTPQTICTVMTADCVPLLLCNDSETQVAAVHAGWQGILNSVIETTVFSFSQDFDQEPLYAWIGPCICKDSFVVGSDLLLKFVAKDPEFAQFFRPHPTENLKWIGDLPQIVSLILQKLGVPQSNIYFSDLDTVTDKRFFSYRRDKLTGRMATMIWLDY